MEIKLQDLHLSGAQPPLFSWLPFDVPEAVTDEKLGWAVWSVTRADNSLGG